MGLHARAPPCCLPYIVVSIIIFHPKKGSKFFRFFGWGIYNVYERDLKELGKNENERAIFGRDLQLDIITIANNKGGFICW